MSQTLRTLAVVGAGNMGSGIAQKMATEGFDVILVDVDDEKVARGLGDHRADAERSGRSRHHARRSHDARFATAFTAPRDSTTCATPTSSSKPCSRIARSSRTCSRQLESVCRPDAILATNTSSYLVSEIASALKTSAARDRPSLLLPSGEEPSRRGHRRHGDTDPRRLSARVGAAGTARQDSDRLRATPAASSSIASSSSG